MYENLHSGCCVVFHFTSFDFPFVDSLKYCLYKTRCRLAVRNVGDDKSLIIQFVDFSTNLQNTTSLSVIVLADIYTSSCKEVREKMELFIVQITYCRIANLIKVMRQYFRRETDGNAFGSLS